MIPLGGVCFIQGTLDIRDHVAMCDKSWICWIYRVDVFHLADAHRRGIATFGLDMVVQYIHSNRHFRGEAQMSYQISEEASTRRDHYYRWMSSLVNRLTF